MAKAHIIPLKSFNVNGVHPPGESCFHSRNSGLRPLQPQFFVTREVLFRNEENGITKNAICHLSQNPNTPDHTKRRKGAREIHREKTRQQKIPSRKSKLERSCKHLRPWPRTRRSS